MEAQRKLVRLSEKERAEVGREIHEALQYIAEKKERVQWMRYEIEKRAAVVRESKHRLCSVQLDAISIEDANQRSKVNTEIRILERDIDDSAFALATLRPDTRRLSTLIQKLEAKLARVPKSIASLPAMQSGVEKKIRP